VLEKKKHVTTTDYNQGGCRNIVLRPTHSLRKATGVHTLVPST